MSRLPQQVATIVTGRGLIRLSQFVTFVLLARFLSPAEFGWFGILTTAFALAATLGSLGFRQALAFQVGQQNISAGESNGTAIVLWPLLSIIAATAVALLYAERLPSFSTLEGVLLIGAGVAGAMFLTLTQGTFLGRGDIRSFTLSESLPRVLLLALVVALVSAGSVTLSAALWAQVGGFALAVPVVAWLSLRGAGRPGVRLDLLGPMLRYGLIFSFNLFLITLGSRLAMFVIEHQMGAAAAGQFFAALRVNEIFLEVATAIGMVLFSNAARQQRGADILIRNARVACWMLWFFLLLAIVIALSAPFVVTVVLGSSYASASPVLQVLVAALAPAAANKIIYPTLAGTGRLTFGTPVIATGLVLNATAALLLVPHLGLVGGALSVVIGQYAIFFGYLLTCRLRYRVPIRDFIVPRVSDAQAILRLARRSARRRPDDAA